MSRNSDCGLLIYPCLLHVPVLSRSLVLLPGLKCARSLASNPELHITVIEKRQFFEYTPAILRVLVEPEHFAETNFLVREHNFRLVHAEATKVTGKVGLFRGAAFADALCCSPCTPPPRRFPTTTSSLRVALTILVRNKAGCGALS